MKAIFFDFDGVLTVDATGTISTINYFKEETNLDIKLFEQVYRKNNYNLLYGIETHKNIWERICQEYGVNINIKFLYQSFIHTPLDSEMFDIARKLKQEGYLIGMITDNKADRIHKILEHYDLVDLFDVVSISAEIKSGKKEEYIFIDAVSRLSVEYNQCVFIDNNADNLVVPRNKGMATIYFDHDTRDFKLLKNELLQYGVKV